MYLDIPAKDFQYYRVVLLVPDIFNRQHLKEMVNLLLNRLGFSAVILHQVTYHVVLFIHVNVLCSACFHGNIVTFFLQSNSISCLK